jgi:branched-chain amino acid transport system substrate-binding protein
VHISGFGARSGVLRSFGINSEAALRAAADTINASGGVKLGDGAVGRVVINYLDTRCNAEEAISVARRIASSPAIVAIGPTCSGEAEPLLGVLQRKVGDTSDTGLQLPIFGDTAVKAGLASISEWGFRNVPSEDQMYKALFAWIRRQHPELTKLYGGVEEDLAHSRATWYSVMKPRAEEAGFKVEGEAKWLVADTNYTSQVRELRRANPDVFVVAAHAFSLCGILREMDRQGVSPKLTIGLTSSSSGEVMQGCPKLVDGAIIPTSFAPINPEAQRVAEDISKFGGFADLHSAASWENLMIIKSVIESEGVMGQPDTVAEDRLKIQKGLAKLQETRGLIGPVKRVGREAIKPFVFVVAKSGKWEVVHTPTN